MIFDIDIKNEKNADIYYVRPKLDNILQYIMTSKYLPLVHRYTSFIKKLYPKYYDYIKSHNPPIVMYSNISPFFIISYILLQSYDKTIRYDKTYIAASNTGSLEAVLYQNVNKKCNIIQVFPKDCNVQEKRNDMYNDVKKLKDVYGNIFHVDQPETKISEGDYSLFIYIFFGFEGCKGIQSNEYQHFFYTCMALNKLENGGTYIFKYHYYSQTYMKQILFILGNLFETIEIKDINISSLPEIYVSCFNYKKISSDNNKKLLEILNKWEKLNPNDALDLNYSDKKLSEKYDIIDEFNPKIHYDTFVTNIIKTKSNYPEHANNAFNKLFRKLDKYYIKITQPEYRKFTDADLIQNFKETYNNKLNASLKLLKKYNIPPKPKYELDIVEYKEKVLFESITLPRTIIVQVMDYDKICESDIQKIRKKYEISNKEKDSPIQINLGTKEIDVKPTERYAVISKDSICKDIKFKLKPQDYNYNKNLFSFGKYAFDKYKHQLNLYKLNIDALGPKKWSRIASQIDVSQAIINTVQNEYGIIITRGFVKMFELCTEFNLVNTNQDIIKSFHTCEAPGHFINATNHYIKSKNPKAKLDWYGNSLNPFTEAGRLRHALGDHYGYLKKYKDRWLFGKDNSGDITNKENILEFKKKLGQSMDLFTSDCGISTESKEEYFNQEINTSKLHFCQCFIALLTLKLGGNAVFKTFIPFSEISTFSIIFLIMKHFESFYIIKQQTSSPENSEVYFIAKNKTQHLSEDMEKYLFSCLDNYNPKLSLFPREVYSDYFLLQMEKICSKFAGKQIRYLVRTFYFVDAADQLADYDHILNNAKLAYARNWIENLHFIPIDKKLQL
ncbi:FtsJ-like methyltransferase [Indivirus ILV1]|uniref:FtsJ-like methyltransferase n=1 Tax=Indivirus ILV1 TaxID=1977633 RepID=A0A1V0SDE0_9VIRU|nr:FtsJ-like methyltransferase [Indivirus ILV1]